MTHPPEIKYPAIWDQAKNHPAYSQATAYEEAVEKMELRWKEIAAPIYREEFTPSLLPPETDLSVIRNLLAYEHGPKGLFLCGHSGRGKSRVTYAIARRMLQEGRTVEILTGVPFAMSCTEGFRDGEMTAAWLKRMKRPDVLFIDDFGKRITEATVTGIYCVLEERSSWNKPTLITTNLTGPLLQERMKAEDSEAILRRLREFCEVVVL